MDELSLINKTWGRIQTIVQNALKSLNEGDVMNEELKAKVEGMIKSALDTFKEDLAKAKKALTPDDLSTIKQMIDDAIAAAMQGETMTEPAKAAKAATEAIGKLQETVKALTETSEKQAKDIADLIAASAKSQHNPPADDDKKAKKLSAVESYAEGLKGKVK